MFFCVILVFYITNPNFRLLGYVILLRTAVLSLTLKGLIFVFSNVHCNIKYQYTVLEIQFRSVNYMLVARICKHFEQNKPFW